MTKRKNPETSHEAYAKVTPSMLTNHHSKIIKALEVLGTATYEQISSFITIEPHAVGRRMKELEVMGIVYKPGTKWPTKSGRNAYQYTLQESGKIVTKVTEKSLPGESISDFSKKLIQPSLF